MTQFTDDITLNRIYRNGESSENQQKGIAKFADVITYTLDRIYCHGECLGNPQEGITEGIIKFNKLLENPTYKLSEDIDDNGDNLLHLIAKYGFFEFYKIIKKNTDFNQLKEKLNNDGLNPYDLAKMRFKILSYSMSFATCNIIAMIKGIATASYYNNSYTRLIEMMEKDSFHSNGDIKNNVIALFKRQGYDSSNILVKAIQES